MSEPVHLAVNTTTGIAIDGIACDVATAQLFRDNGWVEMFWPGCELVDVTDVVPQPGIGWRHQVGSDPEWVNPAPVNPPPDPAPERAPEPGPSPTRGGDEPTR